QVVVIVDSQFPATKRASPELRDRLEKQHFPVIYTREVKGVTISLHPDRWEISTMVGRHLSGEPAFQKLTENDRK
ncbi:MAG TPA: hypothetical protein VKA67_12800, partial [Verrucomicrobiae bacterium]|nr:hypothetical protein [Verrucomicrobiae bacterium]